MENKTKTKAKSVGRPKAQTKAKLGKKKDPDDPKANDPRRSTRSPINDKTSGAEIWRMYLDYVDDEGSTGKGGNLRIHMISFDGFNDYINSSGKWMYKEKYIKTVEKIERHMRARYYKYASSGDFSASFVKIYYDMYLTDVEEDTNEGTILKIVDNRGEPEPVEEENTDSKKDDEFDEDNDEE